MSGLTTSGFTPKTLLDLLAEIKAAYQAAIGISINLGPRTPQGQVVANLSSQLADLWEGLEQVYNGFFPDTAAGTALDQVVTITGIVRLPQRKSLVTVTVTGAAAAPFGILKGAVDGDTSSAFTALIAGTVGTGTRQVESVSESALVAQLYTVTINGTPCSVDYTSGAPASSQALMEALKAAIDAQGLPVVVSLIQPGAQKELQIAATLVTGTFTIAVGANLATASLDSTDITFQADAYGAVVAQAGTLTNLTTPTANIYGIINGEETAEGRLVETDAELRLRRADELQKTGTATVDGMRDGLMNRVTNIQQAIVIENPNDTADLDGRPPHSVEVVVDGGLDQDIINEIWKDKPAGIQTCSTGTTVAGTAYDTLGLPHFVEFSRPTDVPIYLKITLVKNADATEPPIYPTTGDASVKQAVADFINALGIGKDVITSRLYIPINTVDGILGIAVDMATTPVPVTDPGVIPISLVQRATCSVANIQVLP